MVSTRSAWLPLACWIAIIVCFVAGTWGGRPSLVSIIPSLVVIYVVSAARVRQKRARRTNPIPPQ